MVQFIPSMMYQQTLMLVINRLGKTRLMKTSKDIKTKIIFETDIGNDIDDASYVDFAWPLRFDWYKHK